MTYKHQSFSPSCFLLEHELKLEFGARPAVSYRRVFYLTMWGEFCIYGNSVQSWLLIQNAAAHRCLLLQAKSLERQVWNTTEQKNKGRKRKLLQLTGKLPGRVPVQIPLPESCFININASSLLEEALQLQDLWISNNSKGNLSSYSNAFTSVTCLERWWRVFATDGLLCVTSPAV